MKETIKELDFITMDETATNKLLTELLELGEEEKKDTVLEIIDNMPYENGDDEDLPLSYTTIFSNESIKTLVDELLENED